MISIEEVKLIISNFLSNSKKNKSRTAKAMGY